MSEPRFHAVPEPLDLDRLVALTGAVVSGPERALAVTGVASLGWAGPADLACLDDPAGGDALQSDAGACLLRAEDAARLPDDVVALVVDDPAGAFAQVAAALLPASFRRQPLYGPGVSEAAIVHPEARLEPDVSIDPGAVVGPGVEIGRGALIGANAVIGANVRIGRDTVVGPGAVVENTLVGDRVTLAAGVRLGQGPPLALGRVIVQDGVEIGSNAVAERGGVRDTILGEACRIGALARVGSDAVVGRFCTVAPGGAVGDGADISDHSTLGAARRAL